MIKPPVFQFGNKSFARALNLLAQFAKQCGVNPAGRPGWAWSADGWVPPYAPTSSISAGRWDLIAAETDGEFTVRLPLIIKSDADVTDSVTITVTPFVPAVGSWVVITIDDTYAPTVTMVETWDSYPSAYEFDGNDFVSSTIRIWKFVAPDTAGAEALTPDVWAIRYVDDGPLRATWATEQVSGSNQLRDVLMLI